ncbi:hypothetical protein [Massilia timonae]|uniref:hypothetical protein n=1 Tax=Massilia timonae TaxID=47229 RepID=UPI0023563535|nr:hypothetical protein [Massilia timonae]
MNVVAWNGAIAGGGLLGGFLLDRWGPASFPWSTAALAALGFAIAWSSGTHGFRPGARSGPAVAGH